MRGKADGAHHAEGIVTECDVGIERGAYNPVSQVVDTSEPVDQCPEVFGVYGDCHGIDSEVASRNIIVECAFLHYGIARVGAVAFTSCSNEFKLSGTQTHLGCAIGAEHADMRSTSK